LSYLDFLCKICEKNYKDLESWLSKSMIKKDANTVVQNTEPQKLRWIAGLGMGMVQKKNKRKAWLKRKQNRTMEQS
jgi:hypothetical protein